MVSYIIFYTINMLSEQAMNNLFERVPPAEAMDTLSERVPKVGALDTLPELVSKTAMDRYNKPLCMIAFSIVTSCFIIASAYSRLTPSNYIFVNYIIGYSIADIYKTCLPLLAYPLSYFLNKASTKIYFKTCDMISILFHIIWATYGLVAIVVTLCHPEFYEVNRIVTYILWIYSLFAFIQYF